MVIQVYTGEQPMKEFRDAMAARGWGEMLIAAAPPTTGAPWAMDNGAFRYAKAGEQFAIRAFVDRLRAAVALGVKPDFAVLPDIPILDPSPDPMVHRAMAIHSLFFSLLWMRNWFDKWDLPKDWNWHLCLQDGMKADEVRGFIREYGTGLFLGGSDAFKLNEADAWCRLAHSEGVPFHYGRCGSVKKLLHAYQIGADSCDSALMLWSRAKFYRYQRAWEQLSANGTVRAKSRSRQTSVLEQQSFVGLFS